jgi:CMP-N,N'-diacetyllegionaminic acid synthase
VKKLFLIPARGGSKGLPRKNVLPLAGRPMIYYTLDAAKEAAEPGDEICVSSDNREIMNVVEQYGIKIPFIRPAELATDTTASQQVIDHAVNWYRNQGKEFDVVVLLQPTSPLRTGQHIKEALALWYSEVDMVVSVKETDANPYYVLFEENEKGFLFKSKQGDFTRRQDCPKVWELNGAIYVITYSLLKDKPIKDFDKIIKYVMTKRESVDIDDEIDFRLVELLL